jgi:hypothetical protein
MRQRRIILWGAALTAAFLFRLAYGLTREFFFEDQTQIFLMGLRYYATGAWPYFGPDVVWTESEIPGALQALLVGLPFHIAPVPEAPFVLVNLLSFGALAAFAWYIRARVPQLPAWLVWGWLMTLPWTLEFSAHILNPSYLLAPSIVFFIGFFEAVPPLRLGRIPRPAAFALMGGALGWVVQIHMSWPLLLPYAAFAWLAGWRAGARSMAIGALCFLLGLLVFGSLVIPTFLVYGQGGSGGTLRNLRVRPVDPSVAVSTLARLFSFASFEIWRFIETDTGKRLMLMLRNLWLAPLAVIVWLTGIWQPIWMLREWFRTRSPFSEWPVLKWLVVGTVVLFYGSFWLVVQPPQAHNLYIVAPVGLMFAAYCWTFVDSTRWRRIAAALLIVNVAYHAGLGWVQAPEQSLYRNREVVAAAVWLTEPEMFAHRRAFAVDGGPATLDAASRPYDTARDVQFTDVQFRLGPRRVSLWNLTLRNRNEGVAFRDVRYLTRYRGKDGSLIVERSNVIEDIFQPGAVAQVEVNDGIVNEDFATATIEMVGAEALLPLK